MGDAAPGDGPWLGHDLLAPGACLAKGWRVAGTPPCLLDKLRGADKLDFSRVVADSSSVRAVHGGKKLDRTQPVAVRRAANIISSSTRKVSRSMSF
jgi:hypothetical protein